MAACALAGEGMIAFVGLSLPWVKRAGLYDGRRVIRACVGSSCRRVSSSSVKYKKVLEHHFQIEELRDGQREVVDRLLTGDSVAAVMPTGSGKSLCYQLPSLLFGGLTLVVSPLLALMKDQVDALTEKGIQALVINSTLTQKETEAAFHSIYEGDVKLLYCSPERFDNADFALRLQNVPISLLAIDEAHCVSEWGHDFRPSYLKLGSIAKDVRAERVLALTATANEQVLDDICHRFEIERRNTVRLPSLRGNLHYRVSVIADLSKRMELLVTRIRERRPAGSTVVYASTQQTTELVASWLQEEELNAEAYHAGMSTAVRTKLQERFMSGDVQVMVATTAFGMGIDKADVRYVYHFNLPMSIEAYTQQNGRAGRDGLPSLCEALISKSDMKTVTNLIMHGTPSGGRVTSLLEHIFPHDKQEPGSILHLNPYRLAFLFSMGKNYIHICFRILVSRGYLRELPPSFEEVRLKDLKTWDEEHRDIIAPFIGHRPDKRRKVMLLRLADREFEGLEDAFVTAIKFLMSQIPAAVSVKGSVVRYEVLRDIDIMRVVPILMQEMEAGNSFKADRVKRLYDVLTSKECHQRLIGEYFGDDVEEDCGVCQSCIQMSALRALGKA